MSFFLDHLPHLALALVGVALFVWMERADRQARMATAGGGGDVTTDGGPRLAQAVGLAVGVALATSVLALVIQSLRESPPGGSLVLTYLTAAGAAALWAGWSMPRRLPGPVRERMGRLGRGVLRTVTAAVLVWGFVIGGMLLSQGVVLPGAAH